jgi:predicted nucleic acid-binding Zn ribbon protein
MRPASGKSLKPVKNLIKELLNSSELAERQIVASCWKKKFPRAAKHSQLVSLVGGRLKIKTDSSVWLQHIKLMQEDIKKEINSKFPQPMVLEIFLTTGEINMEEA